MKTRLLALVLVSAVGGHTWGAAVPPKGARAPVQGPRPQASFESLSAKAAAARSAGQLDEAAGLYEKAIALRPTWAEGRMALATLLFDLKRYAEAREHLQKLTTAAPKGDGLPWALLGFCASRLGDHEAALTALDQARTLGISTAEMLSLVLFERALLLNRTGSHDAAFDALRPFAREGQDSPSVIVAFGLTLLRLRQMPDEVPAEKREMVRLAGRGGYQMGRARRMAVGRQALEELVSRYPAEPNVHYALGTYLAMDDPDAALEEFRRELRNTPDHPEALIQIAHVETRQGNASVALPFAEKAVSLVPDFPAARLVLGRALLELARTDDAIVQLERALALAPESAVAQFALSRAYKRAGRTEAATHAREEFLRLEKLGREPDGPPGAATAPEPEGSMSNDRGGLN